MTTGELGEGVGVAVADNPGPLTLDGTLSYRIGTRRAVLLDPGPDRPGGIDRLVKLVGEAVVEWICLTHAHHDHAALASRAAEEFGASLAASPETLARIRLEGRPLGDGDRIEIDGGSAHLDVLETPGHSADSLSFCLQPARWLFTGDTVLGEGSTPDTVPRWMKRDRFWRATGTTGSSASARSATPSSRVQARWMRSGGGSTPIFRPDWNRLPRAPFELT
jgi:glyoxylase-like metal-dependent hydrolase (beta-lactamase superfamily II)